MRVWGSMRMDMRGELSGVVLLFYRHSDALMAQSGQQGVVILHGHPPVLGSAPAACQASAGALPMAPPDFFSKLLPPKTYRNRTHRLHARLARHRLDKYNRN